MFAETFPSTLSVAVNWDLICEIVKTWLCDLLIKVGPLKTGANLSFTTIVVVKVPVTPALSVTSKTTE